MPPTERSGLARRLASNTLHAASGRVASLLLWLVLTPPLYRSLGVEGFAVWSLFFALTGYLGSLDLGLASATLRHVSASHARGDDRAAGGFATVSVLGYALLGLAWLAILPLFREPALDFLHVPLAVRPGAEFAFTMGAVVFAMIGVTNTIVSVLQGYGRFDLANLTTMTVTFVQGGGIGVALWRGGGLEGVVGSTAIGWTTATFVGLVALRAGVPAFGWASPRVAGAQLAESVRFGAPLQLANMLAVAHQQLDKLLLARWVALAAVAPYELGLRIATSAATFPTLLLLALVPASTALHTAGESERLRELYRRANRYVLAVAAIVTSGVVAGGGRVLAAWLGHPDAPASLALRGLMLASFSALSAGMASATARGMGRTDLEAEYSGVALVVHIVLGLVLVRRWGLMGALVALVAGNVIGGTWFIARVCRTCGWPRLRTLLEPLGVPLLALVAGFSLARTVDGALAPASGAAGWPGALAVSAIAALTTAAGMLAVRYLSLQEALAIVRPRPAA
ncbi:MAG TPA: lipopolysaccharide biosynthesis protein [Candidatus Acidoferrales bacterium]|nr:lipopolysaccharide biosynthesis protein [Candidatus Acidoferrales bacterium]